MAERDELLRALDACLASLEKGASLDSALAAYPALAADLRPLLVAARSAGAGSVLARVPTGAQAASRSQFLASAADRRPALVPAAGRGSWTRLRSWLGARSLAGGSLLARTVTVGVVVLAGLGAGGYGAVAASAQSLPGDALYGVKRTVENTELLLAPDAQARSWLQTEFDDRRVREAQAVASQGRKVAVEFTGTLISMDGAQSRHWLVSGIMVLVGPQVPVEGEPMVGAQVHIVGTVQTAGQIEAQQVTVLPYHAGMPDATPTASATDPETTATATAAATMTPVQALLAAPATATPTAMAATTTTVAATAATATPTSPPPTATRTAVAAATATDDHGGGPGPSASQTPQATEAGGDHDGNPSETPAATEGGGDHDGGGGSSPSNTPQPTDSGGGGGSGPSPSNTPQPTDSDGGGGGSGPSPSNTPRPTDSGGGGSGPSPSNTP